MLVAILLIADTAFAEDKAKDLVPMLEKITGSLSGTFGKLIMGVGLVLSAIAGLAGMNKAVVLTPAGVGLLLVNTDAILKWIFGS